MFEIDVLAENWDATQAFLRCQQSYVAGMAGAFALGFSALEIDAGCRLAGIAPDALAEVSDQVREMGAIAAGAINERSKQ